MTIMQKNIILCILYFAKYGYSERLGFIVNGAKAPHDTFSHSASLSMKCAYGYWRCGASILNQRLLLTAAHCLKSCAPSGILILIGSVNVDSSYLLNAKRLRIHNNYESLTYGDMTNDIGIIVSGEDIRFGPNIKRVALVYKVPRQRFGYVAGWGIISENVYEEIKLLRFTKQKILDDAACLRYIPEKPAGTFCALSDNNQVLHGHPAVGDSGSAMTVREYIQVGIVSYRSVEVNAALTVYTNVSYYLNWIKAVSPGVYCRTVMKSDWWRT